MAARPRPRGWVRCADCCAAGRAWPLPTRPNPDITPGHGAAVPNHYVPGKMPLTFSASAVDSAAAATPAPDHAPSVARTRSLPLPLPGMAGFDGDLGFAHVLADAADDITMRRFRALDLRVEAKPDLPPVSDADLAVEESLRNVLSRARPRDAMLGEESGRTGSSQRCWVIDPIDGTKNYVRGVPVWATLIGLMD